MPLTMLHPALFALGLGCVAIPIILHLLKRKRRPIPWGAMRFLEEAYRKRRRIITLEQMVLLALRCLLVLLIALGVGSLMLGSGLARSVPTTMIIVLDDSIGSALMIDGMSELDRSKALALAALEELDAGEGDQAAVISASRPATGVVLPESNDLGAVRALIESMAPTDAGLDLGGAMALAREIGADPERPARRVMLIAGSGRGAGHDAPGEGEPGPRAAVDELLVAKAATAGASNIGVTAVIPTRSLVTSTGITLPMGVRVELMRSGPAGGEARTSVRVLDHAGRELGERTLGWAPGQTSASAVVAIDASAISALGASAGLVRAVIDDDANPRDNQHLTTIPLRRSIAVGVIDRAAPASLTPGQAPPIAPARWVRAALAPDDSSGISIVSIEASRAGSLITPGLDALVVLAPGAIDDAGWDRITQLHESGALLVITPDAGSRSSAWAARARSLDAALLGAGASLVEHEPALTMDPEIPPRGVLGGIGAEAGTLARAVSVSRSLTLGASAQPIARLGDGSALGVQSSPEDGSGLIVVLGVALDLEWTNLPARPVFVAMMQEIVRQGVGIGSSMPQVVAGDTLDAPAWARSSRRLTLGDARPGRDQGGDDTRAAGVIARLDAQGATRELAVINPDAPGASADVVTQETLGSLIGARVDAGETRWVGRDEGGAGDDGGGAILAARAPSVSIALWMLLAAGAVALIELVLARLFTAKLISREMAGGRLRVSAGATSRVGAGGGS